MSLRLIEATQVSTVSVIYGPVASRVTMDLPASARDAYIFTYPLVMNYRTMYMRAIAGDHGFCLAIAIRFGA